MRGARGVRFCVSLCNSGLRLGTDGDVVRLPVLGDTITETPRAVSSIAYLNEEHVGEPNVALLAKHVQARLADLRMSTLATSSWAS